MNILAKKNKIKNLKFKLKHKLFILERKWLCHPIYYRVQQRNIFLHKILPPSIKRPLQNSPFLRRFLAVLLAFLILTSSALLFLRPPQSQAWYDDSYAYRQQFTFTHNADITSERRITFSLDTAELIADGAMQADCDDTRFTDLNGKILRFQLTGTCNNAATTYEVVFPAVSNGPNMGFIYYGNPTAVSASQNVLSVTELTPSGGDPAITTRTSEEKAPSPALYLRLDEGYGTIAQDTTANNNDAAISGAAWKTKDLCLSENCLFFDGSDDLATVTNADAIDMDRELADALTYQAWIRVNSDGEANEGRIIDKGTNTYLRIINEEADGRADLDVSLDLAGTNATATVTDGITLNTWTHVAITYTDDADDEITIYIDGVNKSTSTNGSGAPATDSNNLLIGGPTNANFHGFIDEIKIYPFERTNEQIKTDASKVTSLHGVSTAFGDEKSFLSQGLIGYWKLDESSGNAADSSGNGITLTNNSSTNYTTGKFGNAGWFDASSSDYFSAGSTINNISTVSFWASPSATTDEFINLTSSVRVTASNSPVNGTVSFTGATEPTIYVNGVQNGTITADTWNHIVAVTATPINADAFEVGRANNAYTNGKIDDVRLYNRSLTLNEVEGLYDWGPAPVGWWKLDEGAGSSAVDSSDNEKTGTLKNGPTRTTGKLGQGIQFDGNDDYISIGDLNTNAKSVSFWVKPNTVSSSNVLNLNGGARQEVGHAFAEQTTRQTRTATSYADISGASISSSNFVAGKRYLIFVTAQMDSSNNGDRTFIKTVHGSTDFTESEWTINPSSTSDRKNYSFMTVWTAVNGEGIKLQFRSEGVATVGADQITLYAMKLDDDLTENTDWFYNEVTSDTANLGTSYVDGATITFTPETAGDDWLVIANNQVRHWDTADSYVMRINRSGEASEVVPEIVLEAQDLNQDQAVLSLFRVYNLGAVSNTFTEQSRATPTGSNHARLNSKIFALNLNKFKNHAAEYDEGGVALSTTDFATNLQTADITPSSAGDVWTSGIWTSYTGTAGVYSKSRLQVDNTDQIDTQTSDAYELWSAKDNRDGVPLLHQTMESLSAASHTIDMDGSIESGSSHGWYVTLFAATTELATSPDPDATEVSVEISSGTITANGFTNPTIYVDGVETSSIGSNAWHHVVITTDTDIQTENFEIGRINTTYFSGQIDDVRVYNYTLSPKQITSVMNADHPSVGSPVASAIGHWKFDEGYGTIANSSGSCATCSGTLTNMDSPATYGSGWTDHGKLVKALNFDGTNDYVDFPKIFNMANSDFTFSAWISKTSATGSVESIFARGGNNQGGILYVDTDGKIKFAVRTSSSNVYIANSNFIADATWRHVTGVFQDTTLYIYIDGKLITSTAGATMESEPDEAAEIGADIEGSVVDAACCSNTDYFRGKIDDVRTHNYALTPDEVKLVHNQGQAQVLGALSTESDGLTASNSAARAYCPPEDTATCNPPVAHLTFDERQGTSANDITGNANTGTLINGVAWSTGKLGPGIKLDGTDDGVNIGTTGFSSSTGTVTTWVNPNRVAGSTTNYIFCHNSSSADSTCGTGDRIYMRVQDGELFIGLGATANIDTNIPITQSEFVHIAMTYDSGNYIVYKNGVRAGSGSYTNTLTIQSGASIGSSRNNGASGTQGFIDDTRIYDYARTPAQIAWEYNQGKPIGHWKLDECIGTTAYDSSGNRNNGTISIGASGDQTSAGTCQTVDTATAWYNGRNGKYNASLNFDGTNDYVDLPTVFNIATGDFTFSAWISKSASTGDVESILARGGNHRGALLYVDSDGIIKFAVRNDPTTLNIISSGITAGTDWKHVVGVWENLTLYLYVDGILKATTTGAAFDQEPSEEAEIGADIEGSVVDAACCANTDYFRGLIDDARIYGYALTPAQIRTVYNEGSAIRFGPMTGSP
jgi:hypothetical protein